MLSIVRRKLHSPAAAAGKLNRPGTKPVTPEEMEFSRLRAENVRLDRETEILKKATAYFGKYAL
jgi:transposase